MELHYIKELGRWSYDKDIEVVTTSRKKFEADREQMSRFFVSYSDRKVANKFECFNRKRIVTMIDELKRVGFTVSLNDKKHGAITLDKVEYSPSFRCMYYHQVKIQKSRGIVGSGEMDIFKYQHKSSFIWTKSQKIQFGWKMQPLRKTVPFPFGLIGL